MLKCTQREPASRPSFCAIVATLSRHIPRAQDWGLRTEPPGHVTASAQGSDSSYEDLTSDSLLGPADLQYVTASGIDIAISLCDTYDRLW